jgi:UrcA family protein
MYPSERQSREIAVKGKRSIMLVKGLLGFLGAWAAIAQEIPATQQIIEEIKVEAPRRVTREQLPFGQGEQVSLSYDVSYADLDLRQTAGVRELEKRIETAAEEICTQLEALFPLGNPSKKECARHATDNAMADARTVIDALAAR